LARDSFEISVMKIEKNVIDVLDKAVEAEIGLSKIRKSISRIFAKKLYHDIC
jgi:hypothetical protein